MDLCYSTVRGNSCICCMEEFSQHVQGGYGFILEYHGGVDRRSWILCPPCVARNCYGSQNFREVGDGYRLYIEEPESLLHVEGHIVPKILKPGPRVKRQFGFGVGINREQSFVTISRELLTLDQFKDKKKVKSNQDAFMFREVAQISLIQADTVEFLERQKRDGKEMKFTFRQILWIFQEEREGPFVYS